MPQRDDGAGKQRGRTGEGQHADDHTHQRARHAHGQGVLGAFGQRAQRHLQGGAPAAHKPQHQRHHQRQANDGANAVLEERRCAQPYQHPEQHLQYARTKALRQGSAKDQHHRQRQPHHAGKQRRVARKKQPHQHRQRQDQVPAQAHGSPGVGALFLGHAQQPAPAGLQVHHHKGGEKVQQRGNGSGLANFHIGHVDRLGHDERDRAHHRRHDLPAHAGRGLDPAGKVGPVAKALHQRNGELPGGDHIGHARAVDGAHQPGRHHGHLGRPALGVAEQAQRKVGEQRDHSRLFQKRAKQNEQKDVRRRHVGWRAVNALGAKAKLADDLVQPIAPVRQRAWQVLAQQAVQQKGGAHQRQRHAHDAARGIKHQCNHQNAHRHVGAGQFARALHQFGFKHPVVQAGGKSGCTYAPAQPLLAQRWVQHKGQQQQKAHVHCAHHGA